MGVVKFPTAKPLDPQEPQDEVEVVKLTPIELAKVEYAATKLGVPVDFPLEIVKWPWEANCTAKQLGISVDENGNVELQDDNLEMIRADMRRMKWINRIWYTFCAGVGIYIGIWILTL